MSGLQRISIRTVMRSAWSVRFITLRRLARRFAAWTRPQEKKPILLLGHMDTVHAVGKFGPEPFLVKDDRVYGPGVYDMKGGDVIALFVLRALNAVGYEGQTDQTGAHR